MSSVAQIPSHRETEIKKKLPSASTPLPFQCQTQVHFHQSSLFGTMEFIGLTCKAMGEMLFTGLWVPNLQKTTLESFYVAGEMVFLELPR